MFSDELDAIAARVSAGTSRKGYIATHEDEYSEESDPDSICEDSGSRSRRWKPERKEEGDG